VKLLSLAARAFNENAVCAAEAGTGVGKSFAYLLPAAALAAETGERVVVSTATITLQQQLFTKDVPFVLGRLGGIVPSADGKKPLKAALIKGRSNYLCLRRLGMVKMELAGSESRAGEAEEFAEIVGWADTTKSGDRSTLPFMPRESLWARVSSDADACLGNRCPFSTDCFYQAAR
jgi:ATP-dependent DNA helicase DinG